MSSISTSSLILQDPKEFQSPIGRRPDNSCTKFLNINLNSANHLNLQENIAYFTRSVARRTAARLTTDLSLSNISEIPTNRYSESGDISLTSVSFNDRFNRFSLIPQFSNYSNLDFDNTNNNPPSSSNAHPGTVHLRSCQLAPFQQLNDMDCGDQDERFSWCNILLFVALIVILGPTVWFIHGHLCATETLFNKVEEELCKLREKVDLMTNNVETGTNHQLATIGKDTSRKLAVVEQMLREIKSCSQGDSSSSEMDCCAQFATSDDITSPSAMADFALESSGGSIVSTGATEQFESGSTSSSVFGIPICCSRNGPRAVIQANVEPGECWAFKGCSGTVTIRLLGYVHVSGVSLEHIPKSISPSGHIDSAPKDFSIVGLTSEDGKDGKVFGTFTYKDNGSPLQYFAIAGCGQSYELIQLQVHSNHGNPQFTCVYRFRVHGKLDEDETKRLEGE